jgi:hypothetical protein
MEALFCALKEAYPLKGFFWEVWTFDIVTLGALSQPEAIENRQMAGTIYQKCVQDMP